MARSTIEWTTYSWNCVTGCTKVSPGCAHCYAERMSLRLQAMGHANYKSGFSVTLHPHVLELPLTWRKPRAIFVNSMSDLFHEDVPESYVRQVFDVMRRASWHTFQVLTKRAHRLDALSRGLEWPDNVWAGVTVENKDYLHRLQHLSRVPAPVRFVSFEPLLGTLGEIDLSAVDWAIVGGESGPGARPIERDWVLQIRDQCLRAQVPFFFKQWGGTNKKKAGRLLDGSLWDQLPSPRAAHRAVAADIAMSL
jgi:protein gp37